MIFSSATVALYLALSAAGASAAHSFIGMAKRGEATKRASAAKPQDDDELAFNLLKKVFIKSDALELGDSIEEDEKDPLLKHIRKWHRYIKGLTEADLSDTDEAERIKKAERIKEARDEFVRGLIALLPCDKDGKPLCHFGHDLSDITSNLAVFGFATADCKSDRDHIASYLDCDNSCIEYFMISMIAGWLRDGGNTVTSEQAKQFVRQNITMVDGSVLRCKSTKTNPKGNKWDATMKPQLQAAAELHGLEGNNRMHLWALLFGINMAFHVAYRYLRTDGEQPLNVLLACTRNVEFLFDLPDGYEVAENKYIYIANCPHPECCMASIANVLVHPWVKLDRYARNVASWLKRGFEGLRLPPKEDETVSETPVVLPSAAELQYFLRKAGILDKSPEEIEAERGLLLEMCRAGGNAALAKKAGIHSDDWKEWLETEDGREFLRACGIAGGNACFAKKKGIHSQEWKEWLLTEEGKEWIRHPSKVSVQRTRDGNELMQGFISDGMDLEDAKELLEEASVGNFLRSIEAFEKHFAIAKAEIASESDNVHLLEDDMKVVILPSDEKFGPDEVVGSTSNQYFSRYGGEEFENDWRQVLFREAGIELSKYSEAVEQKIEDGQQEKQAARDEKGNPEVVARVEAEGKAEKQKRANLNDGNRKTWASNLNGRDTL